MTIAVTGGDRQNVGGHLAVGPSRFGRERSMRRQACKD
jgi:hypothetical protein